MTTLDAVQHFNKENELLYLLEDVFSSEAPDITDVNDFLWFDTDWIYEQLGIADEDEQEDED